MPYFFIKKILNSDKEISVNKKNLRQYIKDFDALELNSYFPEDWKKVKKFASKNKMPLISDSDAHFLDEILTSFYEVKNLNFQNPGLFKKSLRESFKKGIRLHARKHGFLIKYKHIIGVILENLGRKIGVLKN